MAFFREKFFPAASGALWLVFLFLDLTKTGDSTWIKFTAICLCCAAALTGAKSRDGQLVALALCFTVAADWFLLVWNRGYLLGICLFLVVQGLYAYRLYLLRGSRPCRWGLAVRLLVPAAGFLLCAGFALWLLYSLFADGALSLLLATFAVAGSFLTFLLPLIYFSALCVNCLEAFALSAPLRRFAWGLLLFVCCDVCVGLWNASALLPAPLAEFSRVGMWFFYLPSQVLIVLSQRLEGEHV